MKRGLQDPARQTEMVRLYVEERWTLAQIGERYGVTKERVRQLLFLAEGRSLNKKRSSDRDRRVH